MIRRGAGAILVILLGYGSKRALAGETALNHLDITLVEEKLRSDFKLAVRIAGLMASSAHTELLMNGTKVRRILHLVASQFPLSLLLCDRSG